MEYKDYIKNLLIQKDDRILLTNKNKSILACVELLEEEVTNFDYDSDRDIILIVYNIFFNFFKFIFMISNN